MKKSEKTHATFKFAPLAPDDEELSWIQMHFQTGSTWTAPSCMHLRQTQLVAADLAVPSCPKLVKSQSVLQQVAKLRKPDARCSCPIAETLYSRTISQQIFDDPPNFRSFLKTTICLQGAAIYQNQTAHCNSIHVTIDYLRPTTQPRGSLISLRPLLILNSLNTKSRALVQVITCSTTFSGKQRTLQALDGTVNLEHSKSLLGGNFRILNPEDDQKRRKSTKRRGATIRHDLKIVTIQQST